MLFSALVDLCDVGSELGKGRAPRGGSAPVRIDALVERLRRRGIRLV